MISIIDTKEKWGKILSELDEYDFYHTYDYHFISKSDGEHPILVVYEEDDKILAIPFFKIPIKDTEYYDLNSVYGYAGPISKNIGDDFNNRRFSKEFNKMLKDLSIVSVFSRLHPYMGHQSLILKNLGSTPLIGKVVNIDLGEDLEVQRSHYSKSTKNRVNKCRRLCSVLTATTKEDIRTFIDIYYENMDRVGASSKYYFSEDYFFDFFNCTDFDTEVLLVIHNETKEPIAGSMFVKTKKMVQFHLSGTRTQYLKLAPANLFLDEMRTRATLEGYKSFNLGGGFGGQEDSLFNFKASFSKEYRDFCVWRYIVNHEIYQSLTSKKSLEKDHDFFPAYRV